MVQSGRIKQKYGRKYNKRRAWDLFSHLAKEITTDLKAFKKYNVNSVPGKMHFEVVKEFGYEEGNIPDDKYKEINDECTKRWHEILDKMIYSFDQISKDYPDSPYRKMINDYNEKYPQLPGESLEEFFNSKINRPPMEEVCDIIMTKYEENKYQDKIMEGKMLFATWFENLWD